jgi:hypothetical protein
VPSLAAGAVGAQLLTIQQLDIHDLAATRSVLHRAEADLDLLARLRFSFDPSETSCETERPTTFPLATVKANYRAPFCNTTVEA